MRIGIVCHPSIGGSGLIATQLGVGLAQKGHEVHFISRTRPFKLEENLKNVFFHCVEGIEYPLFDTALYTFSLTAKIVEVVSLHQLDVVHAHYSIPHSLCAFLASEISEIKFPTITTIHGTDVTIVGQDKPLYPLNEFSINKSTIVTTVSNFQRQYIKTHFDIKKSIEVIHNFVDIHSFTPKNFCRSVRQSFAEDDEKILMHISNFRSVKNTATVISVFQLVHQKIKSRLVLLGSGPDIEKIKALGTELDLLDKITFLGDINHVETILPIADCVIQPSFNESFSMVVLEAMACAVPTVSSNVDGIPEVVDEGVTGFMADPDDIVGLVSPILELFRNETLRAEIGNNGRKRAETMFNWDSKVNQYIDCYERAIGQSLKNECRVN